MESILILSGTDSGAETFAMQMRQFGFSEIKTATNAGQAKRQYFDNDFDIILINSPLTDEMGLDFAELASYNTCSGIILIVKEDVFDLTESKLERVGVTVISKPLTKSSLHRAIFQAYSVRTRLSHMKKENIKLQKRLDEMRIVCKAKCYLIQFSGYTEEEAHRFIEKEAMDGRKSKVEVAEDIIEQYEI